MDMEPGAKLSARGSALLHLFFSVFAIALLALLGEQIFAGSVSRFIEPEIVVWPPAVAFTLFFISRLSSQR